MKNPPEACAKCVDYDRETDTCKSNAGCGSESLKYYYFGKMVAEGIRQVFEGVQDK